MNRKGGLHALSPFVFAWQGAKKGTDRFYVWSDYLFHSKRKVLCQFFNLYLYIFFIVFFQYYPFFSC